MVVVVLSGTRVDMLLFLLILVVLDRFREKSGKFWEMVSLKPKVFREFLGFWVGSFELFFYF